MKITYEVRTLKLRHTFATARNSSDIKHNVFVKVEHYGKVGWGEAAPNIRYNETSESCMAALAKIKAWAPTDPFTYVPFLEKLQAEIKGEYAAKAALDMAIMDWLGRSFRAPLYRIWGLDPKSIPATSMTVGINTPEYMQARAKEAAEFHCLKIKLGTDRDRAIIEAIRQVTDQPIRVDANEGWRDRESAAREIDWLAGQGVELVEQPLPAAQLEDAVWLKKRSALPLVADEAFTTPDSISQLKDAYHGINIKLMKCGGTLPARQAITMARFFGLRIMLGCMIESSVGIAAAAHLAPLVDWIDLDGNLLISDDPFLGVPVKDGRLVLSDEPGLGVHPKEE